MVKLLIFLTAKRAPNYYGPISIVLIVGCLKLWSGCRCNVLSLLFRVIPHVFCHAFGCTSGNTAGAILASWQRNQTRVRWFLLSNVILCCAGCMRNLKLIFLRMYGPLAQRLLFSLWFVGSLVYQAALAPVGLNLVASDFHAENKQRKQNRDNMALLSSSTRFGFSVQLLDLSVCKWICMSLKGFHYQVSILDLHRMATECWTTCSRLARKYTDSLAPPFLPVHVVAEKRGVMARFIVEINCLKRIRLSFSCCACVSPLLFLFFYIVVF